MKDLIIGDLHIGSKLYPPEAILKRLRRHIEEVNPDRVFFLGDLFDSSLPDPRWVYQFLRAISDVEWYAIDGNHDIHSGLLRSALMVFGYNYGELRVVDNYGLVPWSYVLKEGITSSEDFWKKIVSNDVRVVLTHFALKPYPKSELLAGRELVLDCRKDVYVIAGHIHEGMLFDNCEHTGSFVPVKINELAFKRWSVVMEDGKPASRILVSWPYFVVNGSLEEILEKIDLLTLEDEYAVLVIESSDRNVLSYKFEIPDTWTIRVNYMPAEDKRASISITKVADSVHLLGVDDVVSMLIEKDDSGISKERLKNAWYEIKNFEA